MGTRSSVPELAVADVAQALKRSERTVRRLVASGELPAYTIGERRRPYLFYREDVERLVRRVENDDDRGATRPSVTSPAEADGGDGQRSP